MNVLKCIQYWDKNDFTFISNCIKYCYENCPYIDGFFYKLYMYNILYNIPLLIMSARYIKSISHKYSKVVFSSREASYLYIIYKKLYPGEYIDLFLTSRKIYLNPPSEYDKYVENIIPKNTLVITLNGTEKSCTKYFNNHLNRSDVDILFLSKLLSIDITEFSNYVRYGSLFTFNNENHVFETLEYPVYIAYVNEAIILNVLNFVNINKNSTKVNFDLIRYYTNTYCKSHFISNIQKKYHKTTHNEVVDLNGIDNFRDFFYILNGENINTFTKSYKNIHIYIIHFPKQTDRKKNIIELMEKLDIINYTFIEPFPPTEETMYQLSNFLGCDLSKTTVSLTQMSHSLTYYSIMGKTEYNEIIIIEDDATLVNTPEDTKILFDYIINNHPKDADSIYLEYCYEECKNIFTPFNKLTKPKCLAAVYYPTLNKRKHILNEVKKFCQNNGNKATDIVLAKLITDGNIISYEHELLFKQDKKFGSHIEGSLKDMVVPFCGNMKSNPKTLIPSSNYQNKHITLKNNQPKQNRFFILSVIMLYIVLTSIFGLFLYKLNKPMLFISYIIVYVIMFIFIMIYLLCGDNNDSDNNDNDNDNDDIAYKKTAMNLYNSVLKEYKKPYNLYTGWKLYRLGDMIKSVELRNNSDTYKYHYKHFPDSIATKYMKRTNKENDLDILFNIIDDTSYERAPTYSLILHLRIGDVINSFKMDVGQMLYKRPSNGDNKRWSTYTKTLSHFDNINNGANKYNINKIIIVTGSHKKLDYKKSTIYINCIKKFFENKGKIVTLRLGKSPDDDFAFLSHSSYLSGTGGGYFHLIEKMVRKRKGIIIN
jgi:hypothetical protein